MKTTIATIMWILWIWVITSTSQLYLSNKRKRKPLLPKEHYIYSLCQNKNSNLPYLEFFFWNTDWKCNLYSFYIYWTELIQIYKSWGIIHFSQQSMQQQQQSSPRPTFLPVLDDLFRCINSFNCTTKLFYAEHQLQRWCNSRIASIIILIYERILWYHLIHIANLILWDET